MVQNFTVSQNRAVTPADFTTYSIPVPVDPRLPNSGQTLGGLRDINPAKFGLVDTYVTEADNFGGQSEVFNGFDFSANVRMRTSSFAAASAPAGSRRTPAPSSKTIPR